MEKQAFNTKVAKEVAQNSLWLVLDSIVGISDSDYTLGTSTETFEQNFEEDLEEKGIKPTERRIKICRLEFEKLIEKIKKPIQKYYNHKI